MMLPLHSGFQVSISVPKLSYATVLFHFHRKPRHRPIQVERSSQYASMAHSNNPVTNTVASFQVKA